MADRTTSDTSGYMRAAALGFAAGLRSMTPLALLTAAAQPRSSRSFAKYKPAPLNLLRSRGALILAGLAALGEFVGDKMPFAPSRTEPGPLGGRIVIGALVGAVVSREAGCSPALGALIGGAAAGAGSYAGATYRTAIAGSTDVPDAVWAILEDATALGLGYSALREYFS